MEIAASFLSVKNKRIEIVNKLNDSNVDYIHFDVMDGKFVKEKNLCIPELVKLLKLSKKKNDVHLMVNNPIKYISQIKNLDINQIIVHVEIGESIFDIINYIKKCNIKVGLAVDLNTDINFIKPYLDKIDTILLMSVKAGYGAQDFNPIVLEKLNEIPSNIKIEIDGGINDTTIKYVKDADIIVSGSYLMKDIENNLIKLKKSVEN